MEKHDETSGINNMLVSVEINQTGVFSRIPQAIAVLNDELSDILGDRIVYISEFIIAKIKGKIPKLNGHPEITDEMFLAIPYDVIDPVKVLRDKSSDSKYLFIARNGKRVIVIEVKRHESGLTEISTIYPIGKKEQRRLEKFPIAYCPGSGGAPISSYVPHP